MSNGFALDSGVAECVTRVLADEHAARAGFYAFHEADTVDPTEFVIGW
ncbi:hypothetical protein AB0F15_18275 [Amycolatopsis sp. NPDC026612]